MSKVAIESGGTDFDSEKSSRKRKLDAIVLELPL